METTMYEDSSYSYSKDNVASQKRKLTLDLNRPMKRQRSVGLSAGTSFSSLLTSPDLHQLKLESPELERMILQQSGVVLNTSSVTTPSQFFFPKSVTEEQEEFAKGFVETLEQMRKQEGTTGVQSNNSAMYTQLPVPSSLQVPVTSKLNERTIFPPAYIKEEPQTVPSGTPPMSPIDMECQEKIKLERKRLRNREAATKCRRRKLEKISRLEDKVNLLKIENTELQAMVNRLKDQVYSLKQEVMDHVSSGCQIPFVTNP